MKLKSSILLFASCLLLVSAPTCVRAAQEKDYLSALEADKIRDAETSAERIKLFLGFAEDRLKKFQYEIEHPSSNRHAEMLNALLNAYIGCVDDAADVMQLGIEKQENIRKGIDLMASRTKEFLPILQKYSANGPELELYKDNLDDAIEGTQDAMNDAEKAKKKVAPPPFRRKHGWRPEGSAFALQCVQYGPCSTERFPGERIRVTHASYNWQRNIKASPERHVFSYLKQETYN